uniref:Uncharacterized protein n=1 Tax=Myoviridae sp. ctYA416 TaxID=2825125 RepID=A0A8S5UTD9_9CAUD|nr:MAG TPA: hypothetical protein [Myoviridae sp. ctYA416]
MDGFYEIIFIAVTLVCVYLACSHDDYNNK